jgi:hypothetical protein
VKITFALAMIMNAAVMLVKLSEYWFFFRSAFSRYAIALQHDRIGMIGMTIIPRFSSAARYRFPRK